MKSLHICIGLRISVNPEMPYPPGGLTHRGDFAFRRCLPCPKCCHLKWWQGAIVKGLSITGSLLSFFVYS